MRSKVHPKYKTKYRVGNWSAYEQALVQRRDVTARVTGHSRNTIARWLERASTAAKRFNQRLLRDFEIIELQADELCTFIGNKSSATWLCAAIEVCSRLWAESVLGRRSPRTATAVLHDVILRGRVVGFPLIATDGFEYDVGVSERLFGSACGASVIKCW